MKRTRKQKIKAADRHVNSQLTYKFKESYNLSSKNKSVNYMVNSEDLASTKKELYRSLITAILILTSLLVIYWVS